MSLTKKRWRVLFACCAINLCLGSIYAWSVFASPMAEHLNALAGTSLTSGDLSIVYTVANSVGPITMISGGWFNDRFGPKKVIFVGGCMFAGGLILSGFASSLAFLIVSYGLLTGFGLGMTYGCTISSCVKYFPDKRGLIGGLTTAVYGFGSVILPPIVTAIVRVSGAPAAFEWIGSVFAAIILVCAGFVEKCPADFVPENWTPPVSRRQTAAAPNQNWRQMLHTGVFYVMIVLLLCGAFSGMMIISQVSAMAQNMIGMTAVAASSAVSVLALFNTFGRVAAGYLSDRIGRIHTLAAACALSMLGLVLLYFSGSGQYLLFYGGISVVGACFGSFMGVFPGFTADQFGSRNNSVNYGIMFIGFALAGYFGPTIMRNICRADGAYQRAFLAACALSFAGLLLTGVYRRIAGRVETPQGADGTSASRA